MIESTRCKVTSDLNSSSDPDSPSLNHQRMAGIPVSVEKELVELAFQIYNFLYKTDPRFFKELEKKPAEFVIFVVE